VAVAARLPRAVGESPSRRTIEPHRHLIARDMPARRTKGRNLLKEKD